MTLLLETRNVCKVFKPGATAAVRAVHEVSLTVEKGQFVLLTGPSGSGKSTVVRCINRMHEEIPGARAEGKVMLDDLDVYDPKVDLTAVRPNARVTFLAGRAAPARGDARCGASIPRRLHSKPRRGR